MCNEQTEKDRIDREQTSLKVDRKKTVYRTRGGDECNDPKKKRTAKSGHQTGQSSKFRDNYGVEKGRVGTRKL